MHEKKEVMNEKKGKTPYNKGCTTLPTNRVSRKTAISSASVLHTHFTPYVLYMLFCVLVYVFPNVPISNINSVLALALVGICHHNV